MTPHPTAPHLATAHTGVKTVLENLNAILAGDQPLKGSTDALLTAMKAKAEKMLADLEALTYLAATTGKGQYL